MSETINRRTFLLGSAAALAGAPAAAAVLGGGRRVQAHAARTLQQVMRGHVFRPGTPGFVRVSHVFNTRFDWVVPRAVARPLDTRDVQAAVRWAVAHDVPLRVKSGGHSYGGYSTIPNGLVLDLTNIRRVSLDRSTGIATIGAGAQLIDVYAALAGQGATVPGGSCPSVGIAGVTLGGGMGLAARAFGMSCDNLVAAEIVTADGRIRQVDRHTDPDLLWALRGGGGGNFGAVTHLKYRVHRLPSAASFFTVRWPSSSAAEAFAAWQGWAPHARDQLTSIFHFDAGARPSVVGQYLGPVGDLGALLAPLRNVPGASVFTRQHDYLTLQLILAGCSHGLTACHTADTRLGGTLQRQGFRAKSDYVTHPLSSQGIQTLIQRSVAPGAGAILFDSYGGAINRVAPNATAFVHRGALYAIQYYTTGSASWLDATWSAMRPYVSGMAYQNYIDPGLRDWQHAYYGGNYPRLLATRRRVDPHHHFNFPQAVGR